MVRASGFVNAGAQVDLAMTVFVPNLLAENRCPFYTSTMPEEEGRPVQGEVTSWVKRILEKWSRRPAAAAISVSLIAVLLQPLYLAVVGAFSPFPKIGYLLWVSWLLVMGPGITVLSWVGPNTLSPIMLTLVSLVFGALLWGCLTYALLTRYSKTGHRDRVSP